MFRRDRSLHQDASFPQRRRTPSFSSSLLDAIYRSIDVESNGDEQEPPIRKKQSSSLFKQEEDNDVSGPRRTVMTDNWIEKRRTGSIHFNSSSTSSDSSSGGGFSFSSSETESSYRSKQKRSCGSTRTVRPEKFTQFDQRNVEERTQQKPNREGGFTKTKLKALKIYGELKKVKQPISPGGRFTSFLNSIFNSGNVKKVKMCSVGAMEDVSFDHKSKSAWSSATSLSRSCLSKTPSSRANNSKHTNGTKRSVKFYPVSVIVDEDCRPCGHKCVYDDDPSLMPMPTSQKMKQSCLLKNYVDRANGVESFSRENLRSFQKKNVGGFDFGGFCNNGEEEDEEEDEDDDDALSYSSSDLFELDHLIGIGRYREELPVYETTDLKTNQAIASGLIF